MRFKQVGNKADLLAVVVHNAEASATIPQGSPVCLVMNATNDGLDVVLPSTSAAINKIQGFRYGVTLKKMAVGDYSEAIVFGFTPSLTLLRQTRSDSTGNWASEAARSVGEYLSIDTVNNLMVTAVSVTTFAAVTASTAAAANTFSLTIERPPAILGQTLASYSSSASATSDTRTAITASVHAVVRMM